nr:chromatin-remodeling ATPase INO80-like [Cherax quadricarinatus]
MLGGGSPQVALSYQIWLRDVPGPGSGRLAAAAAHRSTCLRLMAMVVTGWGSRVADFATPSAASFPAWSMWLGIQLIVACYTWGPFLIITPASTLHNWTGEIARFVPSFQVVPYWGNPEERKNLRKFFDGKNLGTREASFHIVVTSYQIVIQDFKFLNRLKWNYMVLDEAQAIKSINSQRWKLLLGFSCRNRLLLSGTTNPE